MTYIICDDCGRACDDEELDPILRYPNIDDLFERVAPGETMPYAECPHCGALMHEVADA